MKKYNLPPRFICIVNQNFLWINRCDELLTQYKKGIFYIRTLSDRTRKILTVHYVCRTTGIYLYLIVLPYLLSDFQVTDNVIEKDI